MGRTRYKKFPEGTSSEAGRSANRAISEGAALHGTTATQRQGLSRRPTTMSAHTRTASGPRRCVSNRRGRRNHRPLFAAIVSKPHVNRTASGNYRRRDKLHVRTLTFENSRRHGFDTKTNGLPSPPADMIPIIGGGLGLGLTQALRTPGGPCPGITRHPPCRDRTTSSPRVARAADCAGCQGARHCGA